MKIKNKIPFLLLLLFVFLSFNTMQVEASNLTLETDIDKTIEIPLTLDASTGTFYYNGNINPGDTMYATIVFKNESEEMIQVRVDSIENMLKDLPASVNLLKLETLLIKIDDSIIYQGPHSNVTKPVTGWLNVKAGESIKMNVSIYLDKYKVDNTYQAAAMYVKWNFSARAEVPEDMEDEMELTYINTGVETESFDFMIIINIIVALVAAGYILYIIKITSKKIKNYRETKKINK